MARAAADWAVEARGAEGTAVGRVGPVGRGAKPEGEGGGGEGGGGADGGGGEGKGRLQHVDICRP